MLLLDKRDYYEVLGVSRKASKEEIRRAYKDLARIFHPGSRFYREIIDDLPKRKHAEMFRIITEAYQTLNSDERRQVYDRTLPVESWDEEDIKRAEAEQFILYSKGEEEVEQTAIFEGGRRFGSVAPLTKEECSILETAVFVSPRIAERRRKVFRFTLSCVGLVLFGAAVAAILKLARF